jgi:uracil phosphoribosyltransferase
MSVTLATESIEPRPSADAVSTVEAYMSGVFEVQHPLIECHLTRLRDKSTPPPEFRQLVHRLASLLAYEATKDLRTEPVKVQTPLTTTDGSRLAQRIGLVPILRAGLGMVEPVLELIPSAEVWHLGLYRDEETAKPVKYYSKLPEERPVDVALILDPMLATGGSVIAALTTLRQWGVPQVKLLSLIASEEGVKLVESEFPDSQIYVCQIDPDLNDRKFIVPGLGDAGDRIFNTVQH